jgi:hypothetical protein
MTITITGLPLQGTVLDTTLIPVETAGVTGHIAATSIKNYVSSGSLSTISATTANVVSLTATGAIYASTVTTTSDVIIGGNLTVYGTETAIGNIAAYIAVPNQPYITNLANITLNNLTANANVNTASLSVTGITTVGGAIVPTSNVAAVNIGSTSVWFNNIYGTAVHALYADLAERYTSDSMYSPGTVVIFGTDTEVTASYQPNDTKVAGVVSTNPAYTMNAGTQGVDVALQGRVPCQVTGTVNRGDLMVTSPIPGVAMTNNNPPIGAVIGKALGNHTGSSVGVIEVVVGRL